MVTRAHVWVSGRVQRVGYRAWAAREASALGLAGWVCNLEDGRVEGVFEGSRSLVDLMVERCREGSTLARVEGVDVVWEEPLQERDFVVRSP